MLERAFRGFAALPAASWRAVLGVGPNASLEEAEQAFRDLVHVGHSDHGGTMDIGQLKEARDEARKELGNHRTQ